MKKEVREREKGEAEPWFSPSRASRPAPGQGSLSSESTALKILKSLPCLERGPAKRCPGSRKVGLGRGEHLRMGWGPEEKGSRRLEGGERRRCRGIWREAGPEVSFSCWDASS